MPCVLDCCHLGATIRIHKLAVFNTTVLFIFSCSNATLVMAVPLPRLVNEAIGGHHKDEGHCHCRKQPAQSQPQQPLDQPVSPTAAHQTREHNQPHHQQAQTRRTVNHPHIHTHLASVPPMPSIKVITTAFIGAMISPADAPSTLVAAHTGTAAPRCQHSQAQCTQRNQPVQYLQSHTLCCVLV